MCDLCGLRPGTYLLKRDGRTYSACLECIAPPDAGWTERNPAATYCAAVWTAALGIYLWELAQHPRALLAAGCLLVAVVGGRLVSLAEEYRTSRSRFPVLVGGGQP